jgi:hypothetical protein
MDLFGAYIREYGYNLNESSTNNPMLGKTHTLEAREKISKIHKGKLISEKHRKRLSERIKGVPQLKGREGTPCIYTKDIKKANIKYTYYLTSPQGLEYVFNNLRKFCIEQGFSYTHLQAFISGRSLTFRGWTGYKVKYEKPKIN